MKRIILFIYFIGVIISCGKDELIEPFDEINWYFIEYREDMDEVDHKIYDIYQKYGVAIFYHDTIGVEDRGWRDINGNINYYYEILKINYDPTVGVDNESYLSYRLPDVSTLEKKKELLPLLEIIDEFLLPSIASVDLYLPCILLVDYLNYGSSVVFEYSSKRSFNFMVVAKEFAAAGMTPSINEYIYEFLIEFVYNGLESSLKLFYEYLYASLVPLNIEEHLKTSPFGQNYTLYNRDFSIQYDNYLSCKNVLDLVDQRDELLEYMETVDPDSDEFQELLEKKEELDNLILLDSFWLSLWESFIKDQWEVASKTIHNYGFLGFSSILGDGISRLPTKEEDLLMYFELVLSLSQDEVYDLWGDYPYVLARYEAMYSVMNDLMDIEQVSEIIKGLNN